MVTRYAQMIIVIVLSVMLAGCYEPISKLINERQTGINIVNHSNKKLDVVSISSSSQLGLYRSYYVILSKNSETRVMLHQGFFVPEAFEQCRELFHKYHKVIYTSKGDRQDIIASGIPEADLPKFLEECKPKYSYSNEELLSLVKDTLSEEYNTCLFIEPDGQFRVLKNTETPWKSHKFSCGDPNAP